MKLNNKIKKYFLGFMLLLVAQPSYTMEEEQKEAASQQGLSRVDIDNIQALPSDLAQLIRAYTPSEQQLVKTPLPVKTPQSFFSRVKKFFGIEQVTKAFGEAVEEIAVTPDNHLVTQNYHSFSIYALDGTRIDGPFPFRQAVRYIAVTPDNHLVTRNADKTFSIYALDGTRIAGPFGQAVRYIAVTPDNHIVTLNIDNTFSIYALNGTQIAGPFPFPFGENVWNIAVTHDNQIVALSFNNTFSIYALNGTQIAGPFPFEGSVWDIAVTPDNHIVTVNTDHTISTWKIVNPIDFIRAEQQKAQPQAIISPEQQKIKDRIQDAERKVVLDRAMRKVIPIPAAPLSPQTLQEKMYNLISEQLQEADQQEEQKELGTEAQLKEIERAKQRELLKE